jgi:hypothetical protein
MIQPLRALHRRTFVALALVLPALLMIGIGARRPRPSPSAHGPEVPATAYLVRESSGLWQKHAIQSKFYSKSDRPRDVYVVLQPAQELNEPDLLLYWASIAPQGNSLPSEAQPVGAFTTGRAFLLPLGENRAGQLVLFSLAHQTVFDTATVERLP